MSMFANVISEHKAQQQQQRRSIDKSKQEAVAAVEAVTGTLLDSVNRGVAQVYLNQQRLEHEAKTLQTQTTRFAKQTNKWLLMYKGLNESLKELGDVKNWAQTIEDDMNAVAASLDTVVRLKQEKAAGSGAGA